MKIIYLIKPDLIMNKVCIIVQELKEVIAKMDKNYNNIILKIYKNQQQKIKNYVHYNIMKKIMEICIKKIVARFRVI